MVQRGDTELELAERDLNALLGLSEALSDTADIEGTLWRIASLMAEVLNSDRCAVVVLDDESDTGFIVAASDDQNLRGLRIELSLYPELLQVARTSEPLVVSDVQRDPLFDPVRSHLHGKAVGSTVLFPVRVDRRVHAVLHLRTERARERALTPRELRFGRIVANASGIAIRNARVYDTLRDRSERRLSERIRAERRLRQIEKYQRFFDLAGDGSMIVDGAGQILFSNRAAHSILGFDARAMAQLRLDDLVAEHARGTLRQVMAHIQSGQHQRDCDLPVLRASGTEAILSLTTSALTEPNEEAATGPLATAIVSFRDVTQTRAMEDELRRTKDFLINLIESSADAIVAADLNGKIILFNQAAEEITGHLASEAKDAPVAMLYPPGAAQQIMADLRSDDHGGRGKLAERREILLAKNGERIPVNLAAAIVYDKNGKESATVGIFSDLRERLRMEEALARAQQRLELSERQSAVVQLAGAAAHELNQPLTALFGAAELLQRRLPADAPHNLIDTVLREAERMAGIVRQLGQLTRYQTKPYLGHTEILDLNPPREDQP